MASSIAFSSEWMGAFQERVNQDPELSWIAKNMNCTFVWRIEADPFLFQINRGKITSIKAPTWNDSWDFSIEGPREVWLHFIKQVPPPLYNDLLAIVSRLPDCQLSGNRLLAMQYIRSLTRMFSLSRELERGE